MTEQEESAAAEDPTQGIDSLEDVFKDPEPAEEAAAEEPKGEEPESAEGAEGAESETPADESEAGLRAALVAERRKRQAAEEKTRQLEETKAPDPEEDPEGFKQYHEGRAWQDKAASSREMVLDLHPDFEEKEAVFMQLVTDEEGNITNPALVAQMQAARNPALFVYKHVQEHQEIEQYRDPKKREAMRAEIAAEESAKQERRIADLEEQIKKLGGKNVKATEVPDLTQATATAPNTTQRVEEEDLREMFADSPF